eukprot:6513265-Prorocentrum_lima.AAC.1
MAPHDDELLRAHAWRHCIAESLRARMMQFMVPAAPPVFTATYEVPAAGAAAHAKAVANAL